MKKRKLIIGSRESKLAVIQSEIIMSQIHSHYPELELELVTMKTTGDIILDRTLDVIGGKGLFVKELDKALKDGLIDISVHSLKDMPMEISDDLPIVAFSKREDPRDVLVLPKGINYIDKKKTIGCSSARRKVQLLDIEGDSQVEPIRGNVLTRLKKLDEGEFSAIVLAFAGLKRLNLEKRVSRIFATQEIIPAAGQGILAVQGRKEDDLSFLDCLNDKDSADAAMAEKEFIKTLDGGCSSPVAAFAEVYSNEIKISGLYVDIKTGQKTKGILIGERRQAQKLGYELAVRLLSEVE